MDMVNCRKVHGYISDNDDESELSSFDENYEELKIPPVPVNELDLVCKTDSGSIRKIEYLHNKFVLKPNLQQSNSEVGVNVAPPFDTQNLSAQKLANLSLRGTNNPFLQDYAPGAKNIYDNKHNADYSKQFVPSVTKAGPSTDHSFTENKHNADYSKQFVPSVKKTKPLTDYGFIENKHNADYSKKFMPSVNKAEPSTDYGFIENKHNTNYSTQFVPLENKAGPSTDHGFTENKHNADYSKQFLPSINKARPSKNHGFIKNRQDTNYSEQFLPVTVYDINYQNVCLKTNEARNQQHMEESPPMTSNQTNTAISNNQTEKRKNLCSICCDFCNII